MDDAEHEVDLQEALMNKTKVGKLVVDKWFVDKGFGFGKAPQKSSSSTPASCKAQKCSWSALTHGRKWSATKLAPREVSSTKILGTKRAETRKGQGEGEPSGAASEASSGAGGGTGK